MPRVIAGLAKGLRLEVPPSARPTADRVKEAIFSSLGPLDGAIVLDLYAGSGGLALEALSRGALVGVCYETNMAAVKTITTNASRTGLMDRLTIIGKAGEKHPYRHPAGSYTHIFADPPYEVGIEAISRTLDAFARVGAITDGALLILERDKRRVGEMPQGWRLLRERRYGEAVIRYGERNASVDEHTSGGA